MAGDSLLSSTPACDSPLWSKVCMGAIRMNVSSIQAPVRIWYERKTLKTVPYRFNAAEALAGARSGGVEAQSEKGLIPATMATPWLTDA